MRIQIAPQNPCRNTCPSLQQPWPPYILASVRNRFRIFFGYSLLGSRWGRWEKVIYLYTGLLYNAKCIVTSYLCGPGYESGSRYRLSWVKFLWFFSVPPAKQRIVPRIGPWQLPSTFTPIHHSLITAWFNGTVRDINRSQRNRHFTETKTTRNALQGFTSRLRIWRLVSFGMWRNVFW
jgi:hypothetical protein